MRGYFVSARVTRFVSEASGASGPTSGFTGLNVWYVNLIFDPSLLERVRRT